MDVLLRAGRAIPWSRALTVVRSRAAESCLAGGLLGVMAACTWLQFTAHWGTSAPVQRGAAATVLLGLCGGLAIRRMVQWSWPLWWMATATVTLISPWWLHQIGGLYSVLPVETLSTGHWLDAVGCLTALLSIGVPVVCWTAAADSLCRSTSTDAVVPSACWGCAGGLLLNSLGLSPWLGLEATSVLAAATALALAFWVIRRSTPLASEPRSEATSARDWLFLPAILLVGGVWGLTQPYCQLLLVYTAAMQQATCAVLIGGLVLGMLVHQHPRRICPQPWWGALLGVAVLASHGWMFAWGMQISLRSSAYLTTVVVHELALVCLIAVLLLPISVSVGMMIGASDSRRLLPGLACFLAGDWLVSEFSSTVSSDVIRRALLAGLMLAAVSKLPGVNHWRQRVAPLAGLAGCILAFWFQPTIHAETSAKLLFSTQTFLAYRSQVDSSLLPQLDDARLVAMSAGQNGPLTLWKSRGTDLLLRESGIPRCSLACRPDVSPQGSPEVLATLFPLLVTDDPRQILVLGSSGGLPMTTFLNFPIQNLVCVEPDDARVEMIRGPIAAHFGTDPFADERVVRDCRPVEFAAAMSDGGYDIILSSPPSNSTVAGMPQFTQEFYRHVAGKLSPAGVFCQRLEAIDFGPRPVQLVVQAIQSAFRDVVMVEIGVGDYLLMATNSAEGLVPKDLPDRLETPVVRRILAKCGWDWSTLLTLSAWDSESLAEFAADGSGRVNTTANCQLAFAGPQDVMRWGPKLQELNTLLTKPRQAEPNVDVATDTAPQTSRRARYLDWLGEDIVTQDILRRLSEVAAQVKIVHDNPDAFWLEYRKALRDELQQRPRTEIRRVSATDATERVLHPEDERRKSYFLDLGVAGDLDERNLNAVYELKNYFEPYDPLMSLFARQETAELLRLYGHPDPAWELALRLHVIHFAPASDCSLRNVLTAAELLLDFPQALPDAQTRFDTMNGLLQSLRGRWDLRGAAKVKSVRLAIQDTDRSMLVIERMLAAMNELVLSAQVATDDWTDRQAVVARVLLHPLRNYRAELQAIQQDNKSLTDAAIQETQQNDKPAGK